MNLNDVFSKENIHLAFEKLRQKPNSCGSDGVMLYDAEEYFERTAVREQLLSGGYQPRPATEFQITSRSGNMRTIYKFCSIDRLVSKALQMFLNEHFDSLFSAHCIAYRKDFGTESVCAFIRNALNSSCEYVIKLDISNYFESIRYDILFSKLRENIEDGQILSLLEKIILAPVEKDYKIYYKNMGILQGNSVSPFISNLYLLDFDDFVLKHIGKHFYRFCDDIAIFCKSKEEAISAYDHAASFLKDNFSLDINKKKSGIFPILSQNYLGYTIVENNRNHTYEVLKIQKEKRIYHNWHTSGLKRMNTTYEIISNGILTVKDASLLFEGESDKIFFPIKTVKNINVYSDVTINGNVLKYIADNRITLSVFNRFGKIIGRFVPENHRGRADTFLKQTEKYINTELRLEIAKMFVEAEVFNMKANLMYYRKHVQSTQITLATDALKELLENLKTIMAYSDILLLEARGREIYFSCYNDILPYDDFFFTKRTRRPPKDAINALISFGNTVFYNYISNEIQKTSLDVKIGYLHATNNRAESLNLDLAEIFKPVIVDRVIFTIINKHIINEQLHFHYQNDDSVYLSDEGKRIFLKNYYQKLDSELTVDGKRQTYRNLIWGELLAFQNFINDRGAYKPFHYVI